jgi:transposase InsO family protein
MPWQEQSIMTLKQEFVMLATQEGANVSALCARFEISRQTGYKWLRRYQAAGVAGLAEHTRRPHTSPGQTSAAEAAAVLALRDAHPTWGGRKLRARLLALGHEPVPVASTITAILARHGRLDDAEAPKHTAWQRFAHAAPNDLWQLDFKGHVPLAQGRCHPLSVLDDHSRFLLGLTACADEQETTVRAQLTTLFRRYGLPWRILSDNGPPWGTPHPAQDLTILSIWLIRLGIAVSHGRPHHPQTQGKVERFHRTLKAEPLRAHAYRDLDECQAAFDAWRDVYNLERPHHALDLVTPASRYQASPRPFPDPVPPIEYGPDDIVRRVYRSGQLSYRGRWYFVSQALRGQPVALRPTQIDGVLAVYFCHHLMGELDLRGPETMLQPPAVDPAAV